MTICPNEVVDICVSRRNDGDRLMGPTIIELDYEKDALGPHIIIGGENIKLRMKKRDKFYVKGTSNLTP